MLELSAGELCFLSDTMELDGTGLSGVQNSKIHLEKLHDESQTLICAASWRNFFTSSMALQKEQCTHSEDVTIKGVLRLSCSFN